MRFIFSQRFYLLVAFGIIPLVFSWNFPILRSIVFAYDILLFLFVGLDWFVSKNLRDELSITRLFSKRFAIGDETNVTLHLENKSARAFDLMIKDEYPPELKLSGDRKAKLQLEPQTSADMTYTVIPPNRGNFEFGKIAVRVKSKLGLIWLQKSMGAPEIIKVYPNMRRAKQAELKALGASSSLAVQRKAVRRGEGREFESMRDYVRGDELRHISWTTTARRARLTSRQYQIERDQTILIAIDAGRLMTGRIDDETKFDRAIHAALALMSMAARGGDNAGIVVFGRRILKFIPPKRGVKHFDAVLEALYDLEPELIEPSYARAFQFISANLKKRALIVILTDLLDKTSSKELLRSLKLLRPRHLPLVTTIGDQDLNSIVSRVPNDLKEVFTQSAAEEIIYQRESALRLIETQGGLALDVNASNLAPRLLETYLKVKERGLL